MTTVSELYKSTKTGKTELQGWVRTLRCSKNFGFIELNDGSFFKNVQVVFEPGNVANFDEVAKFNVGCAIKVTGEVLLTPDAPQPFEVHAKTVELVGDCPGDYPLQKKRHGTEFLRTISHLRPRTNLYSAIFRVRSEAAFAIHKFFNDRGFVYVHTPIITASDAEGAGQMFHVTTFEPNAAPTNPDGTIDYTKDFFGKAANLTVSGQLEGETFAMALRNVYTFGPTFRAENSNTARHAAEFWMIEPEMAFCDLDGNMDLAEELIKYIINYVREQLPEEMEFFTKFVDTELTRRLDNIVNSDFMRITYTEAIDVLINSKQEFEVPVSWGIDMGSEHERFLTEKVYGKPVFVTGYPKEIKAFYMRLNDDNKTVSAMDCLVPGVGEIIGGSQREDRLDILTERIIEMGMNPDDYWWYLDLRKYGGVYHSGFGMGFERMIMYLTGVGNIRDAIPYPRVPKWAEF